MRELAVHYCPECGFYAFYQLSRNAVCPRCARKMTPLDMRYQDFMDLDCAQRDELLSRKLIEQSPLVSRLMKPHRENNTREIIANLIAVIGEMEKELRQLEAENKKQKDTVEWMHRMIWDMVKKQRLTAGPQSEAEAEADGAGTDPSD